MKKILLSFALVIAAVPSLWASSQNAHFTPLELNSRETLNTMLREVKANESSKDISFEVGYLERVSELLKKCKDPDSFGQALIISYPTLHGAENVKGLAKALYPNAKPNKEKEVVRERVQDYFNMVSNLDKEIALSLWAERDDVSIITPKTHFVGVESIMNDFLFKAFSTMKSRKLHSLNEVINIYGNSANVQLYWIFDTVDATGAKHQTRGRESLIFAKISGVWRLTHVHYSRMPQ